MKVDVMLFVRDVEASSRWYQELLGAKSGHGGAEYEMIVDHDDTLLFQLHQLEGEEHSADSLADEDKRGAGVHMYVLVDDLSGVHRQAASMGADLRSEPQYIELARHTEFIVRDPDGYSLAIYSAGNTLAS
jgi:catechol 2,3-dioxygenase-like lactoylglutathione lyase family enzyme